MTEAEKVLAIAEKEIGTQADDNLNVKFSEDYGWPRVAWCVIFQWWCAKKAGCSKSFYDGKKVASCTSYYNWAKQKGYVVKNPQPGDLVIFQFGTDRHMGRLVSQTDKTVTTIDGNTDLKNGLPKGGIVAKKTRNKSYVFCYIRPQWNDAAEYYIVKPGDTLNRIAVRYGYIDYKDLMPMNPGIKNPNLINPGQKIRVK